MIKINKIKKGRDNSEERGNLGIVKNLQIENEDQKG